MLRSLAAVAIAVLLVGCGASPEPPRTPTPPTRPAAQVSPREEVPIGELGAFVTRMRGRPFKRALPNVELVEALDAPKQFEPLGRYDERAHVIRLKRGLDAKTRDATLVHELVHAYQTDHGVSIAEARGKYAPTAFVEGEAELIELAFRGRQAGHSPEQVAADVAHAHGAFFPLACRKVDPGECVAMSSATRDGRAFVAALYRAGGPSLLDQVYAKLPSASFEILFPEELLRGARLRELTDLADANAGTRAGDVSSLMARFSVALQRLDRPRAFPELRQLRGFEWNALDKGFLLLLDYEDPAAATSVAALLRRTGADVRALSKTRLLAATELGAARVGEIAKRLRNAAPSVSSTPPYAARPVPSRVDRLSDALAKGLASVGFAAAGWTSADDGTAWQVAEAKFFVYPTSFMGIDDDALHELVARTWPAAVGPPMPKIARAMQLGGPLGELTVAEAEISASLDVAIARVPMCNDSLLALHFVQYAPRGAAARDLRLTLAGLTRVGDPAKVPACEVTSP